MKALFFAILVIITYSIGIAQSTASIKYLDSLKHQLSICKEDTSRTLIMAELCNVYRTSKPDTALYYGEKAISFAPTYRWERNKNEVSNKRDQVVHCCFRARYALCFRSCSAAVCV